MIIGAIFYNNDYEWHYYNATDEAERWLVRQDGLRGFKFKKSSQIQIDTMIVMFAYKDLVDEISIYKDQRICKASFQNRSLIK